VRSALSRRFTSTAIRVMGSHIGRITSGLSRLAAGRRAHAPRLHFRHVGMGHDERSGIPSNSTKGQA
jgi:hypothetical protein